MNHRARSAKLRVIEKFTIGGTTALESTARPLVQQPETPPIHKPVPHLRPTHILHLAGLKGH